MDRPLTEGALRNLILTIVFPWTFLPYANHCFPGADSTGLRRRVDKPASLWRQYVSGWRVTISRNGVLGGECAGHGGRERGCVPNPSQCVPSLRMFRDLKSDTVKHAVASSAIVAPKLLIALRRYLETGVCRPASSSGAALRW